MLINTAALSFSYTEELTFDDSGEPILYEDEAGNEYVAAEVHYTVKRK